jgi:ectoine hydroxylase-related dioxygenase (phytanoyl-CoA dioxygenase family)
MRHDPRSWKQRYDRDGYLIVEDVIDPQTLAKLRGVVERITSDPASLPPDIRRLVEIERDYIAATGAKYNDLSAQQVGTAARKIMETPLADPAFADLICYEPVLDVLEALFDSTEFSFHNYKAIIKSPHVSSRFRWHRDLPYLEHSTPNMITAMLCLDEMTEANGATVVFPGSHRVAHEDVTQSDREIPDEFLPKSDRVTVTCPAGSAVLFHVSIIHGGSANRSNIPRRNLIGIWAGPDTYPITPARYVYQDLMPRSQDPARQRQTRMSFPHLFGSMRQAVGAT